MNTRIPAEPKRKEYLDHLRVFAIFAVIILHVSSQNWYTTNVNSLKWQVFNIYDSVVRWSAPVFVMISGSLFLNREIPVKKIYSKYVLRMILSFFVWSGIYVLIYGKNVIKFINGPFHMWFILMITGLYICLPVIKRMVGDDKTIRYYLGLSFIFCFLLPQISLLADDFANPAIIQKVSEFNSNVSNMNMQIVLGYASYFILGHYLDKITLSKRQRFLIYLLGAIGFILTISLDAVVSLKTQQPCSKYYANFTVNVLFESIAVFVWFKYQKYNYTKINIFISYLSKYSFGVYLVHVFIIDFVKDRLGLNTLSFHPLFSVVCIGIIVFLISFAISALLNHIPAVKGNLV